MRKLGLRVGDHEVRREIVEGAGRIGQLMRIPRAEPLRIAPRRDQSRGWIDSVNSLAESERAASDLIRSWPANVPIAPQLIAQLPQQTPMLMPVLVHVANPIRCFLWRTAAQVQCDLRLGADEIAEEKEFVRAKCVVLRNAPRNIQHSGSLLA